MVAPYKVPGDSFVAEKRRAWSETRITTFTTTRSSDPAPDGKSLIALMPAASADAQSPQDHVVFYAVPGNEVIMAGSRQPEVGAAPATHLPKKQRVCCASPTDYSAEQQSLATKPGELGFPGRSRFCRCEILKVQQPKTPHHPVSR